MVRRMLANCGHPVVGLHRVRYGEVRLADIAEGDAVAVEESELQWVFQLKARRRSGDALIGEHAVEQLASL